MRDSRFSVLGSICDRLMGQSMGVKSGKEWDTIRKTFAPHFNPRAVSNSFDAVHQAVVEWLQREISPGTARSGIAGCARLPPAPPSPTDYSPPGVRHASAFVYACSGGSLCRALHLAGHPATPVESPTLGCSSVSQAVAVQTRSKLSA